MRTWRGLLLCFFTLVFPIRMLAYSDWLPITPEELKMTSIAQQPGAPAVVLYNEEIDDDLKHSQTIYTRVKILTEAGKKYGDVEIPYDSKYLEINSIKGRTIQPDGTISNFEGKPFDRVLMKGEGVKWKVKAFAVPNVEVGSIVEYRFVRDYDTQWLLAPTWVLQGELFRVKQHLLFIPTYRDVMLRHEEVGSGVSWNNLLPPGVAPRAEHGIRRTTGLVSRDSTTIELTLNNTPAFVDEPYMPAANLLRYHVNFYYDTHRGNASRFWNEEGKYWSKEVEDFIRKRAGLAEAVRATVAPSDTKEQKARKIYAFVQSLQNLDYTTKRSEQEMKALGLKNARGVENVLRQKMGDGEDLARLYVAMAREAGLEASMMRVAKRENWIFDENYLSFDQLNHEIVIVKLDAGEVKLDPGVRYCPFGLLYWKHSDTRGLRQNAKGAEIAPVMSGEYTDGWLRRDANFKLGLDGRLEGSLQVTYKGQRALSQRLEYWKTDDAGKKKALEDEVKAWLPANAEVTLANQPEWESEGDLVAEFQVSTPAASSAGHRYLLPLDIIQLNSSPRFTHAERTWPITFNYPYRTTDHLHLVLPPGMEVESIPAAVSEKLEYAVYNMKLASKGNEIEVLRDVAMAGSAFQTDRYVELKTFYDKVKAGDSLQAVLKGAANASGN
jgi:hypothetical protein